MKNKIFALVALMLPIVASADSFDDQPKNWLKVDTMYEWWDDGSTRVGTNEQVGHKFTPWFSADIKQYYRYNYEIGTTSNRIEGGVGFKYSLFSLRTAVGERFALNNRTNHYYSIEPGIGYNLTKELKIRATYRYRSDFGTDVPATKEMTHSMIVGADYDITPTTYISASYLRTWGETGANGTRMGLNSPTLGIGIRF